jgi:hypothetical protein
MIDHLAETYARANRPPRRYGAEAGIALGFACAAALFIMIFGDIAARAAADRIAAEAMIGSAW